MIIKRKRTATAPTYTIKKSKAKNSTPKKMNKQAMLKKTNTKNKTECIGFLATITKKAQTNVKHEKKINKLFSMNQGL
jgi:hypothetical protein